MSTSEDWLNINQRWRPARSIRTRKPNDVWRALTAILEPAIRHIEPAVIPDSHLEQLYTYERLDQAYRNATPERLGALPHPWNHQCPRDIGYVEADLLTWLSRFHGAQPVMAILASRGTGKTATLHHLFRILLPHLGPFRHDEHNDFFFWPVIIDLRSLSSTTPSSREVVEATLFAIQRRAASEPTQCFSSNITDSLGALLEQARNSNEWRYNNALVIRAITLLRCNWQGKGVLQPLFGFDNLDKLHSASTESVLSIARALALDCGCKVIIPARPWTRFQEAKRSHILGQFVTNTIALPPPDLHSIIQRRVACERQRHTLGDLALPFANRTVPFSSSQAGRACDHLLHILSTADIGHRILVDLCNYDVRNALIATRALLRYSSLPIDTFLQQMLVASLPSDPQLHRSSSRTKRDWGHTTVDRLGEDGLTVAIMVDDRYVYHAQVENGPNVVLNLFDAGAPTSTHNYTIQYRILSFLDWRNELVTRDELRQVFMSLGYGQRLPERALRRLFETGLLNSPESDEDYTHAEQLSISMSGEFYLSTLSTSPQYICECLCDTPLSHAQLRKHQHTNALATGVSLTYRIDAWIELIHRVYLSERDTLPYLVTQEKASMFDPREVDFLSERLLDAARHYAAKYRTTTSKQKSDDMRAIDRLESAVRPGAELDVYIRTLQRRVAKSVRSPLHGSRKMKRFTFAVQPNSQCTVEWPAELAPKDHCYAKIELTGAVVDKQIPIQVAIHMRNAMVASVAGGGFDAYATVVQMAGKSQVAKVRVPMLLAGMEAEPPRGVVRALMSGSLLGEVIAR